MTVDVHEIKLSLRYPNSRQEDITDAFMRGYQEALKIGHDSGRRFKAEKTALEARIDELCAEVERSKAEFQKMDVWHSQELKAAMDENAKLRELVRRYVEYTSQDRCEGCVFKSRCNDGEVDECWQLAEIRGLARELGIEGKCAKS